MCMYACVWLAVGHAQMHLFTRKSLGTCEIQVLSRVVKGDVHWADIS